MHPLEGVTVVTLEHAVAGPFCTRQLADLGARVIKIERPGSGDFARGYDERVHGLASHFVWTNRSKESLTLDVKHPEAQTILARLLTHEDVLVQNLAPGAAARDALRVIIVEAFAAMTAEEVVARLDAAQIANARMNDMREVWHHAQLKARGRWTEVETPAGPIPALLPPGLPNVVTPRMDAVPALGQHSDAILRELGYATAAIEKLRADGAI